MIAGLELEEVLPCSATCFFWSTIVGSKFACSPGPLLARLWKATNSRTHLAVKLPSPQVEQFLRRQMKSPVITHSRS